jgi:hypothetical protein
LSARLERIAAKFLFIGKACMAMLKGHALGAAPFRSESSVSR